MKNVFLLLGAGLIILAGCQNLPATTPELAVGTGHTEVSEGEVASQPNTGIANPASVNCLNQGGTLEIRENKLGQYGVCLFEDNRQCEEWALWRGNCPVGGVKITGFDNEAEIFCAITGGQVEGVGTATPMCKRVNGTLCNVQSNFDGDCPDPNDPNPNAGNIEVQ